MKPTRYICFILVKYFYFNLATLIIPMDMISYTTTHYQNVQQLLVLYFCLCHRNEIMKAAKLFVGVHRILQQCVLLSISIVHSFILRFHFLRLCLVTERKPHRYMCVISFQVREVRAHQYTQATPTTIQTSALMFAFLYIDTHRTKDTNLSG